VPERKRLEHGGTQSSTGKKAPKQKGTPTPRELSQASGCGEKGYQLVAGKDARGCWKKGKGCEQNHELENNVSRMQGRSPKTIAKPKEGTSNCPASNEG